MAALLWWTLSLSPLPGWALQTVTGPEQSVVKVSSRDLNRIALPSKILKAYTSKPIEVKVEGSEAYVKIPATVTGLVELYLLTEDETYSLMLVPAPIPAETVLIKAGASNHPGLESGDYIRQIKSLFRDVANNLTPAGYDLALIAGGKEECPVKECSLVAVRRYTGARFLITEYRLSNPTNEQQTYHEGLFTRTGTRAVAIEQHEMQPGGVTRLFWVEEGTP
jgi:hypothetical protein